jgi:NAD(P)-dependent dehydrogenase (short-subunit alcohol dehydrogenase family)
VNGHITQFQSSQLALITAGAAGIGRCIAEAFLAHGCQVYVCDINADSLSAFLAAHPQAQGRVIDVANAGQVEEMFADIEARYGRLDILVNNAGIAGPTAAVESIAVADWDRTIAVDLNAQFYVTRCAVPLMKQAGRGSIINIASNAAFFGFPLRSAYTAAKWAMIGLTKTWAMELGPHNIRVNALCPGSVNGERIDRVLACEAQERGVATDDLRAVYARQSSMRLFIEPEDVANSALFLASDLGTAISGQAIGIDGHTEGLSNWLS